MLPEEKRQQLDGIVSDMLRNKENDGNIKFVVEDFKKKYDEPENNTQTESYQPGGVAGGIKRGISGIKEAFKSTTNANADIINSNQSGISKIAQIAGKNVKGIGEMAMGAFSGALSSITPDAIEKPVVDKTIEVVGSVVNKIAGTDTAQRAISAWNKFSQDHPEASGNIKAAANFADFFANSVGAGKGAEIAGKTALKTATEGVKITGKGLEATGSLAKTATSLGTGLEKSTIEQILKTPGVFSKKEISLINRESMFDKAKNAIDKRISELSETGKGYESIRKAKGNVVFEGSPVHKVLDRYGIKVDDSGKLILSSESAPLSTGDITALENFIKQYGNQNTYSYNAILNARQGASKLADYGADKTDVAGKIGREIRGEFDSVAKTQVSGLAKLDEKFAPETKLLTGIRKVLFNSDGSIKDNAISKIANLTGKGKEQTLKKIEKIIPGIREDINILKAIEDIEITKGKKVGTYLRGGTGGFILSGGNPAIAIISAIATSPQVAIPLIRGFAKIKNIEKSIVDKIIGKMKTGEKLIGKELEIANEAVDNASKKVSSRIKNIRPGLNIEDISKNPKVINMLKDLGYRDTYQDFVQGVRAKYPEMENALGESLYDLYQKTPEIMGEYMRLK